MISVTQKVHFVTSNRRRRMASGAAGPASTLPGRVPRISKLMALAIRFDGLIRNGKVTNLTEISELAHVTQPRMTQIMNLLHLAPDIQEELLHLPPTDSGRDEVNEKKLRPVCAERRWPLQRQIWRDIAFIATRS